MNNTFHADLIKIHKTKGRKNLFLPFIILNLTSRVYFLSTRIFLKNYSSSNH